MTNGEATEKVLSGYRLPIPEKCPTEIYELMCKCWYETPSMRPSMKEVFNEIEKAYFKIKPRKFQESSRVIESGVEDGLYNNWLFNKFSSKDESLQIKKTTSMRTVLKKQKGLP